MKSVLTPRSILDLIVDARKPVRMHPPRQVEDPAFISGRFDARNFVSTPPSTDGDTDV